MYFKRVFRLFWYSYTAKKWPPGSLIALVSAPDYRRLHGGFWSVLGRLCTSILAQLKVEWRIDLCFLRKEHFACF